MRRVKDALGVTLNDLMLAAVAGAVGRYHDHRHVHAEVLQCMVPISLRQDNERQLLGNRVGMCNIALPVVEPDALIRPPATAAESAQRERSGRGVGLVSSCGSVPETGR